MDENPTADNGGASIDERIEKFLAGEDSAATKEPATAPETPEATEAPAEDAQASDEPQIELSTLAKVLGVDDSALDVDESGAVFVKTKIDGKEGTAKFVDLVKSYQLQGHVDAKARAAAAREQQVEQQTQSQIQYLAQLGQLAEQELMREFSGVNWAELARNDPAEYVARKEEFDSRQARLGQYYNAVKAADDQQKHGKLQQAAQYMAEHVPGWSPGGEVDKSLSKYAASVGIESPAQLLMQAPQIAVLLQKAMLYDSTKDKAAETIKKVVTAPKLVKPGQSTSAQERKAGDMRSLKETIRKSGGKDGVIDYLLAAGKV